MSLASHGDHYIGAEASALLFVYVVVVAVSSAGLVGRMAGGLPPCAPPGLSLRLFSRLTKRLVCGSTTDRSKSVEPRTTIWPLEEAGGRALYPRHACHPPLWVPVPGILKSISLLLHGESVAGSK